jgi:hypothetical protein
MSFELDTFFIVILVVFGILSVLSNVVCAIIFSGNRFKTSIFRLLSLNSIVDGLLELLLVPIAFTNSTLLQSYVAKSYWLTLYKLIVQYYLARSLGLFSTLINLKISIDRLARILIRNTKSKLNNNESVKLSVVVMLFISYGIYFPKILFMRISNVNNTRLSNGSHVYLIVFQKSSAYSSFVNFLSNHATTTPVFIFMVLVNISLVFCLINKVNIVSRYSTETQRCIQRNVVYMVIWITTISAINQLLLILAFVIDFRSLGLSSNSNRFFLHFLHIICHSANIIIYYVYDENFSIRLKIIFVNKFRSARETSTHNRLLLMHRNFR